MKVLAPLFKASMTIFLSALLFQQVDHQGQVQVEHHALRVYEQSLVENQEERPSRIYAGPLLSSRRCHLCVAVQW
jgi:hypothetical protein